MVMKCEVCHERQATVVLTIVVEDEKTTQHMCSVCAKGHGFQAGQLPEAEGVAAMAEQAAEKGKPRGHEQLGCPNCGLTYTRFKERYRLGCAVCYDTFRERLTPLLRKVQNAETHMGKRFSPAAAPLEKGERTVSKAWTLEVLKRRLTAAIEREEFEEAARLRDQIEAMKQAKPKDSRTQ